jgi:hypothetical protein
LQIFLPHLIECLCGTMAPSDQLVHAQQGSEFGLGFFGECKAKAVLKLC